MYVFDPARERSVLGKGAFGLVFRMVNPFDGGKFAVKELSNIVREDGMRDKAKMAIVVAEVRKMSAVQSDFIVRYITSCFSSDRFYIVMELLVSAR